MGLSTETTRVPDLVGLGPEEAKGIISDYFLNLGAITYDESFESAEDSTGAFIWRQYPDYDEFKRLNMGMEIDIWLSLDSTLLQWTDSAFHGDDIEIMDE
jgi:hypothetical protein